MKENEVLMDVIKLTSAAYLEESAAVKRQALADIYAEIGSLLAAEKAPHGDDESQGMAKFLTVAEGVQLVRFAGKDEIKLVARRKGRSGSPNTIFEILVNKTVREAVVSRDNQVLFVIRGVNANYSRVEQMAVSALHRWFQSQRPSKQKRKKMRRQREGIKEEY